MGILRISAQFWSEIQFTKIKHPPCRYPISFHEYRNQMESFNPMMLNWKSQLNPNHIFYQNFLSFSRAPICMLLLNGWSKENTLLKVQPSGVLEFFSLSCFRVTFPSPISRILLEDNLGSEKTAHQVSNSKF